MHLKAIIAGRLDFGTQKSFDQVSRMYDYRIENYYKNDILINEDIFNEEELAITIPRLVVAQVPQKLWNNTTNLIEYLAQFALSGKVGSWLVKEGVIQQYLEIEPSGDKAVVQSYLKGRKLSEEEGKESEALAALTKTISKYDNHAQAYERRGYVNYLMSNWEDAMYDFTKCLKIDGSIPAAYFWRAKLHMRNNDFDKAIEDFDSTTKKAIALQPVYWQARLLKAKCHLSRKEYEKAAYELKLFTKRKYEPDNPNYKDKQAAIYQYAEVLMTLEQYDLALEAIEHAINFDLEREVVPMEKLLTLRGILKERSGASGVDDWQKAADLGSQEAEKLLAENTT